MVNVLKTDIKVNLGTHYRVEMTSQQNEFSANEKRIKNANSNFRSEQRVRNAIISWLMLIRLIIVIRSVCLSAGTDSRYMPTDGIGVASKGMGCINAVHTIGSHSLSLSEKLCRKALTICFIPQEELIMTITSRMKSEITDMLQQKLHIGESRLKAKADGTAADKVFSWNTYHTYKRELEHFAGFCHDTYGCKCLTECEKYAEGYIRHLQKQSRSAWSQATIKSALVKAYGHPFDIRTEVRHRDEIVRGRHGTYSFHFSEEVNAELVNFCRCTGLRRSELSLLKGRDLVLEDGQYYVHVNKGKGGKSRNAIVIGNDQVVIKRMLSTDPDEKVWGNVSKAANIHGYRAEYACKLYRSLARNESMIPVRDRYICRKDRAGLVLDKQAMKVVSKSLGHNRVDVIAQSYLYHLSEKEGANHE